MSKSDYRLESHSAHTGELVTELPFSNLQAEFFINKEDNLRFDVPANVVSRNDFYPGIHEAWLYWNDIIIYQGPLWSVTVGSDDHKMSCESEGLLSYLAEREVRKYSATDYQDNHAWAFIDACQQGNYMDLRITRGLYSNAMARVPFLVQPWQPRKVLDAITDLANTTGIDNQGFDFDIDAGSRAFNTWYPRKGVLRDEVISYPKEIRSYSEQIMARPMVNDLRMLGSGSGSKQYYSDVQDPLSIQRFIGMQNTMSYTAAKTRPALIAKLNYNIDLLKFPKIVPAVEINMDTIEFNPFQSIGDIFQINIDDGWVQYNKPMRQAGMQLTVRQNGQDSLSWYLNDTREVTDVTGV